MKIDEMLSREDFYGILLRTLNGHFSQINSKIAITNSKHDDSNVLHTYDKLNAIISEHPSKKVRAFLKTEYTVDGTLFRRLLVKAYLSIALHTKGLFAKKNKLYLNGLNKNDIHHILIYPCNKKIRIFNFKSNEIDVVTKAGFPNDSIKKEIEFRTRHKSLHVEPIIDYGVNWYRERIIDGTPLARINNSSEEYIYFKKKSLDILISITDSYKTTINTAVYIKDTIRKIKSITESIIALLPSIQYTLEQIETILVEKLSVFDTSIALTLSHGDFHHGNIWIEKINNNIIIIDWETYDVRSEWYDIVTLYGGLRETIGIEHLQKKILSGKKDELSKLIGEEDLNKKIFIVLFEDLLFRADDLKASPLEIGCVEFDNYCKMLLHNLISYN